MSVLFFCLALFLHFFCVQADCPDGWTSYGDSCYSLYKAALRMTSADHICGKLGAHLVTMETKAENDFIKKFMLQHHVHKNVWIGANDILYKDELNWFGSFKKVSYEDWYPGEPDDNSGSDERCVVMTHWEPQWADVHCEGLHFFICEKSDDDDDD